MARKPTYEKLERRVDMAGEIFRRMDKPEEELRGSKGLYWSVFEYSNDGVGIVKGENFLFVNEKYAEIFGYDHVDEIIGKPVSIFIQQDDCEHMINFSLLRQKNNPSFLRYKWKGFRRNGDVIYLSLSVCNMTHNGEIVSVVFLKDVTRHQQVEKKREHLNSVLRAIRKTNELLVRDPNSDVLLQGTCDHLVKSGAYEKVCIALFDKFMIPLSIVQAGFGLEFFPMVGLLKRAKLTNCTRRALNQSEIYLIDGLCSTCTDCPMAKNNDRQSVMLVRLEYDRKTYGLLTVIIHKDLTIGKEEKNLFKKVASKIGFALHSMELEETHRRAVENNHALTQQLIKAQENERQLISRELHDSVAQDLSSLVYACETLFDSQDKIPNVIRHKAMEFSRKVQRTVTSIRDLAYDLRPPSLDQLGLAQAIFRYAQEFSKKTGLRVNFASAGMDRLRLDFICEINAYRLVQEGLSNIRKHANAKHVKIRIVASFPNIIIRIEDDGKGFDVEKRQLTAQYEKRMGLQSMEERAMLLGGKMSIQSRLEWGTRIFIEFPYKLSHDKLKIGFFVPTAGPFTNVSVPWYRFGELAAKEINESGGMKIGNIRYFWDIGIYNTGYAAMQSKVELKRFIAQGGRYVGGFVSVEAAEVAQSRGEKENIFIIAIVEGYGISFSPNKQRLYAANTIPTHEKKGEYMSKVMGKKKAAAIVLDNDWGYDIYAGFEKGFKNGGGKMVAKELLVPTDVDFSSRIIKMKAKKPDALVIIMGAGPGGLFLKQARELGMDQQVAVIGMWGPDMWSVCGQKNVDGALYSGLSPDVVNPKWHPEKVKKMKRWLFDTYGTWPNHWAWLQYDSVLATSWAIMEAQSIDPKEVIKAIPAAVEKHKGEFLTGYHDAFVTPRQGAYIQVPAILFNIDTARDPVNDSQYVPTPEKEYCYFNGSYSPGDPIYKK